MIFHVFFPDALNSIENSIYRTAFKLRSVQTLCQCKYRISLKTWNNLILMYDVKFTEKTRTPPPCEWLLAPEGWVYAFTLLVTEMMEWGGYSLCVLPTCSFAVQQEKVTCGRGLNFFFIFPTWFLDIFFCFLFRIPIWTRNKIIKLV